MPAAVIMAGGRGERFWPWSRIEKPKQLLPVAGHKTMIQEAVERIEPLVGRERIFIVAGEVLRKELGKQLPAFPPTNLICEPCGRNTAAAIGLSAIRLRAAHSEKEVMIALPADHVIGEEEVFRETLQVAAEIAAVGDVLVTVGIRPSRPETGYGYIKAGREIEPPAPGKELPAVQVFQVERFVEKPDEVKARRLLVSGVNYWNAGIFIWSVKSILQAIEKYMPDLHQGLLRIEASLGTQEEEEITREVYEGLESVSIDYGIMEKADNVLVAAGNFHWDDVGNWLGLARIKHEDGQGNVVQGDHVGIATRGCIIFGEDNLITTLGVEDLVIVAIGGAVLVAHKERAQEVKEIVKRLSQDSRGKPYL